MRFSRDRRGYENTFVLHGERRRGKGRPRLLYWFRTPPEIKVGRAALDDEAVRLIEELNPDIQFDWTRILRGEGQESERPRQDKPSKARARTVAPPESPEISAPPQTPAHARLGGEAVARLRGRYAEILARIGDRITDEARQAELRTLAERLNPDTWVTDDEVKVRLDEYEGVLASLRAAVGSRRRRRRRGGPGGAGSPEHTPDESPDADAEDS